MVDGEREIVALKTEKKEWKQQREEEEGQVEKFWVLRERESLELKYTKRKKNIIIRAP